MQTLLTNEWKCKEVIDQKSAVAGLGCPMVDQHFFAENGGYALTIQRSENI